MTLKTATATAIVFVAISVWLPTARAQHSFDVLVQQSLGQLVAAGCCNGLGQWTTSKRVFSGEFDSSWQTNNPGYGAFGTGASQLPAGTQTLPGSTALFWDFKPMTINGQHQNVYYWNGQDSDGSPGFTPNDVSFGPLPGPSYTLSLFDKNAAKFSTDGTNTIVAGGNIGSTMSDGSLHFHRFYFLEDNDDNSESQPADGIYLIAERFRMNGLLNSDPAFIVLGTPGSDANALDLAAVPWVEQHVAMLTGQAGDYNQNLTVDAADYVLWRKTLGQIGSTFFADGNYNNQVDAGDYTVWRNNFGATLPTSGTGAGLASTANFAGVPESSTVVLFLIGFALIFGCVQRRDRNGVIRACSMRHLRATLSLIVLFAAGDRALSPRLFADDGQLPPFDQADTRDAGAPDPQFADGSPGQYVLTGSQWPQPGGKGTPITLTYSYQNMFGGALKMPNGQPLPASLIRGSIEEALRLWASAAPLNFVEVPDDGLWYGSSTHFGQLRFRHIYINGPDPVIGDPVAKAQAYYPPGPDYAGDVEFDDSDKWQEVGTLRQPDILGAAIHEIGHTLGLGHATGIIPGEYWSYQVYDSTGQVIDHLEPKGNADMFWIFTRYGGLGTGQLLPDDIAGIRAIYGGGVGSVTSLVPEPSTLTLLLLALFGRFLHRLIR